MCSSFTALCIYLSAGLMFYSTFCAAQDGQLEGNFINCDKEGDEVALDITKDNPCIRCYCKSGIVNCEHTDCRSVEGCHNIIIPQPAKSCCRDSCQVCMYNNITVPSGETIQDKSDPCVTLQCHGGILTRSEDVCHVPCKNPVILPGQCCPVCQGCEFKDKTYANGMQFKDNKDPCVICHCVNGNIECKKRSCPQLNCPTRSLLEPAVDQCCPTCVGKRKLFPLNSKCLYHPNNRVVYSDGEAIISTPCQSCTCRKGTVICYSRTCPRLKCKQSELLPAAAGECCPSCPPPKKKCKVDGKKIKHGRTWFKSQCTECVCKDGVTHCWNEDCSSIIDNCPKGTHEVQYIGGLCCPQCIEISATCFVFGDPHYRTFDGLLYTFQGTCQYTLAQQCSRRQRTFSIQVKNSAWPDKTHYAYTDSVLIATKHLQVELKQQLKVHVNKQEVELPYIKLGHISIIQRGYSLVVSTSHGVTVIWDGLSYLEVDIPQRYKDKMCGLCGNYNGISDDDFIGRHKTNHTNAIDFANSWERGQSTCKLSSSFNSILPIQSCMSRDRDTTSWINSQCEVLTDYTKTSKCKMIGRDVAEYQSQCMDKLCECDDPVFCYCQSAMSLLKACQAGDLQTKFRESIEQSCKYQIL